MTPQEAITRLKCWLSNGTEGMTSDRAGYIEGWFVKADVRAFEMAIHALEQEPCEDCISRQMVIELGHSSENELVCQDIKEFPPVAPQPKMGRWIEHFDESGKWYECDQCHTDWGGAVNYCPNCGADMRKESKE